MTYNFILAFRLPTRVVVAIFLAIGATCAQSVTAQPAQQTRMGNSRAYQVGDRPDGSAVLPTDQEIHPAGRLLRFFGRANAIAIRPDGRSAVVLKGAGNGVALKISGDLSKGPLLVLDLASGSVVQEDSPYNTADSSFNAMVYSQDGTRLYASDPNGVVLVMNVASDGELSGATKIQLPIGDPAQTEAGRAALIRQKGLPETSKTGDPVGLAISPDGLRLYVAMNMNNSLAVVDLATNSVVREIPVGNAPYSVIVDGGLAYVTNQGGRVATASEFTTVSAGTPIVADPVTGMPTTGTVSVVDLAGGKTIASIPVGIEPTAMILHQTMLFVVNTNSDTVSIIDPRMSKVIKTISIEPFAKAPFGSSPNGLLGLPDGRLVVSLGVNNALAIYDWRGPRRPVSLLGFIPTAWYPTGVALDQKRDRLIVPALKGLESAAPARLEPLYDIGFGRSVSQFVGALSFIDLPPNKKLAEYTRTVIADNRWTSVSSKPMAMRTDVPPRAIPERLGEPSKLKYIFYVIKENLSYDQILGDVKEGNGDQENVEYGKEITPNHHALVNQFPLLDNFYVSGTVSYDGHSWADSAFSPDYVERGFTQQFVRGYGGDPLGLAPTGLLWEDALRHGKSVQIFGEGANHLDGPKCNSTWNDWFHDSQVMEGKIKGPVLAPSGSCQASSFIPSVDSHLYRDYPMGDLKFPDQYRADLFLREFHRHQIQDDLPNLTILLFPCDHTALNAPEYPTPRAEVADNDLAVGRFVDAVSHSRYWKESAIFIVEDDASNGTDHVDGHRAPILVISPYARRGFVDHTYYTHIDVVRTIEQILDLTPMNQRDLVAMPMSTAFTNTPDLAPFNAVPNEIAINERDAGKNVSMVREAWQHWSSRVVSGRAFKLDSADENLTRRILWYAAFDYQRPFPGDKRILFPSEVPRSREREDE